MIWIRKILLEERSVELEKYFFFFTYLGRSYLTSELDLEKEGLPELID